jgi:hypothetical protein
MTYRKAGVHRASNLITKKYCICLEADYGIGTRWESLSTETQNGALAMMSIGGHYVQN